MAILNINSEGKKEVLVEALTKVGKVYRDICRETRASRPRKAVLFTDALLMALSSNHQNGLFLEPFEAEIVKEGLEMIQPISTDHIKLAVMNSQSSWGSIDVAKLASNLNSLIRNVQNSNKMKIVAEMLSELNDGVEDDDDDEDWDFIVS